MSIDDDEDGCDDEITFDPKVHDLDKYDCHDPGACWECLHSEIVENICKCGECCRALLIEVDVRDAEREPKIAELGSPNYWPAEVSLSGKDELIGYIINKPDGSSCLFLDDATNKCTIYETRPLNCRLFNCDGEGKEQLIELGHLNRDGTLRDR